MNLCQNLKSNLHLTNSNSSEHKKNVFFFQNSLGKGENPSYWHFLLFLQRFLPSKRYKFHHFSLISFVRCNSFSFIIPRPCYSISSLEDLRIGCGWFKSPAIILFLRIDDGLILLTAVHCFDAGYMGKQRVAWKEYCAENSRKPWIGALATTIQPK